MTVMALSVLALAAASSLSQFAPILAAVSLIEKTSAASLLGALSARASVTPVSVTFSVYFPVSTLRASMSLTNVLFVTVMLPLSVTLILEIIGFTLGVGVGVGAVLNSEYSTTYPPLPPALKLLIAVP